jgi:hypothetical protein
MDIPFKAERPNLPFLFWDLNWLEDVLTLLDGPMWMVHSGWIQNGESLYSVN